LSKLAKTGGGLEKRKGENIEKSANFSL